MRRIYFAIFAALIAWGATPVRGMPSGSVTGKVCDSAGTPQIGAVVQLLRPDLAVLATVYTDGAGKFSIPKVLPGRYALKAMGTAFLPSLRENIHVRSNTVVNLTLNTLFEVLQWLPAEPRAGNSQKDDWAWTMRSAANRPLLRWLEDGPLVVVADGSGAAPKLKARLMATGQAGSFGESGERYSTSVEETPSSSRELLARVDFAPGSDAGIESMLGFRQDLGFAGSVQSVAAIALHPEIEGPGGDGLDEAAVRTWETMNLGDEFEAEVGSTQVLAGLAQQSPRGVVAALPFATVGWRDGNSTVHYGMTTFIPGRVTGDDSEAQTWMPRISARGGSLALEHGLHQEIGWERRTDASGVSFAVFADSVTNPIIEATGHFFAGFPGNPTDVESMLFDRASGLLRSAGPDFSSMGMQASIERRLPGGNRVRLSYANGDVLAMPATGAAGAGSQNSSTLGQLVKAARSHRAQTYALALSGTLDGSGTRWRASYRWQSEDSVTGVAPFAVDSIEPYLNLHVRQPLRLRRDGAGHFDALLDVNNLLGEGYRPGVLSDGSILIFAQDQRSFRAGLAFTF